MKKYPWFIFAAVLLVLGALYFGSDILTSTGTPYNSFISLTAFIDTSVNRTIAVVSIVVCFLYVLCSYIGRK
jgi:hypothetical protein